MKRIIASLLIMILCFSCATVLADEPAELTCLDIPWFSTPKEASDILVKAGIIFRGVAFGEKDINTYPTLQNNKDENGVIRITSNIAADPKDQDCPYMYNLDPDRCTPLSRKLATIWLVKGINGKYLDNRIAGIILNFTSDKENRQLVECVIAMSGGADQEDVLAALEKTYGKPTVEKRKQYIWLGANNTIMICYTPHRQTQIVFATIDGLNLAETYDIQVPE